MYFISIPTDNVHFVTQLPFPTWFVYYLTLPLTKQVHFSFPLPSSPLFVFTSMPHRKLIKLEPRRAKTDAKRSSAVCVPFMQKERERRFPLLSSFPSLRPLNPSLLSNLSRSHSLSTHFLPQASKFRVLERSQLTSVSDFELFPTIYCILILQNVYRCDCEPPALSDRFILWSSSEQMFLIVIELRIHPGKSETH